MIQRMFVTIDTKKTNYKNVGKINHGDDLILELTVLSDGNMISFNNPMVDLLVKKSDGKMIRQNSGIEHIKPNKFIIEVSKDCVTSPGLATNQLIINDNGRISTCMFYYTILNSLEEDVIQSISSVEVLEQLDEYVIEARERMELLNNGIKELEELFGATSDNLVEAEMARNEAEQNRAQSEILRLNNENDRIEADNIRNQNEADRLSSELVREERESERILNEEERHQNESERMIDESARQQNESTRQSNESVRISNENDRKTQENRRATAETNRVNAETTRRNNENSRISNETERQKTMNEMKSLLEDAREFDERVGVIEDEIEEINSSLDDIAINVKSFGAKGDGITDDTKAIQDSIDYIESFGGGTLLLPKGVYKTSYTILFGSNIKILGYGATLFYETTIADTSCIASRSYDGINICENSIIEGITINTSLEKGNGIGIPKANNIIIRDVKTTQLYYHLVDMPGATNIYIYNCYAKNCVNAVFQPDCLSKEGGLYIETKEHNKISAIIDGSGVNNINIINCTVKDCGYGVQLHRNIGKNVNIFNCNFENGIYGVLGDQNINYDNITIKDCYFNNFSSGAIHLKGVHNNVIIENNTVENSEGIGIAIDGAYSNITENLPIGHIIKNNKLISVYKAMAITCSNDCLIQGNKFIKCSNNGASDTITSAGAKNPTTYALVINRASNISISDNYFKDCKISAICIRKNDILVCDNLLFNENVFENCGGAIVFAQYTNTVDNYTNPRFKNIKIINNHINCNYSAFYPILVGASDKVKIENNTVLSSNTIGIGIDYSTNFKICNNEVIGTNITGNTNSYCGISVYGSKGYLEKNRVKGWEGCSANGNNICIRTENSHVDGESYDSPNVEMGTAYANINYYSSEKPTRSTMELGTTVYNTSPKMGDYIGWIYLGDRVWKGFGRIED